tara:strand:+ start:20593 stop:21987 length:1395 start_codon:yes stop_codon:yes gene_type:complete
MSSDPLVTIYIPCRNYGRFLKQSVESVLYQLYENWELILIDEASEDDTSKISKNFLKKYPEKIKFIKNDKPMGLQKLANHILKIANGKYMMRLDADDWMDEGALLIMVKKLEASKKAGLIYGNYYYANSEGKIIGIEMREALDDDRPRSQLPPHGACTLFRTRALKSVGGYSEEVNAQDGWDLWYKLADRIGAISVRSPIFYYRQHDKSMSKDNEKLISARSKIFEQAAKKLEGDYKPTVVAVIPVKESYPDFEGVPFQEVYGKSLLENAILSASKSEKIDSIIVSSESKKVLNFSQKLETDGKVPKHYRLLRKEKKISKNSQSIPIRDFMFLAGEFYKDKIGSYPDVTIYLSMHAVNRRTDHIDKALNVLRINESDSVVSVQEEREPMFGYSKEGLNLINPGRFKDLVYQDERLYKFNGCLIATWWEVLQTHGLFGEKISFIEMSYEDSFQIKSKSMLNYIKA